MWECGLKHRLVGIRKDICNVTPYVGVWIETRLYRRIVNRFVVTPYVGVWIETMSSIDGISLLIESLLMWECGLKRMSVSY